MKKSDYMKRYYIENKEKILKRRKEYLKNNKEKILECKKKWYKENPEYNKKYYKKNKKKLLEEAKLYRKNNPEKVKRQNRLYRENNPEKSKEAVEQWRKNNILKIREKRKEWLKNKRKIDLKFNLNNRIGKRINYSLKNNRDSKIWRILEYTKNDLMKRLKYTIPEGYYWQDYIDGELEIDHIIPISVFNFDSLEHIDFKKCWALSNLHLLPTKENLIKRAKLEKPFQPTLKIIYKEVDTNEIEMV